MKFKTPIFILVGLLIIGCNNDDDNDINPSSIDYKQEMRLFVQGISSYAKSQNANFIVIPQNGVELVTIDGDNKGNPNTDYLDAIDAVGQEDLFYGYNNDNEATPSDVPAYLTDFLDICIAHNVKVLVTDYCSTPSKMDDSYSQNKTKQYISFAAPERGLTVIPSYPAAPRDENTDDISSISQAKNFLYLINPSEFTSADDMISQIQTTNYDALIIDAFFNDVFLTSTQVNQLKTKTNGGTRKVIAYMSIGEAEDYRYYWEAEWKVGNPSFIKEVNPDWEGNFKVEYWNKDWQAVIYGNSNAYLDNLLASGFDGTYLDIIDGFEYFEN